MLITEACHFDGGNAAFSGDGDHVPALPHVEHEEVAFLLRHFAEVIAPK